MPATLTHATMSGFTDSQYSQSTVGNPSGDSLSASFPEKGEGSTSAALSWMPDNHRPRTAAATSAAAAAMTASLCLTFIFRHLLKMRAGRLCSAPPCSAERDPD